MSCQSEGMRPSSSSKTASGSRKLFTLSALYSATRAFLQAFDGQPSEERADRAVEFWEQVASHFHDWELVRQRKLSAGEVRRDFIHSHGVVLQAIGRAGSALIRRYPKSWAKKLSVLASMDWARTNPEWEGRAMIGGRVSKSSQNVSLTCNAIKQRLGLELTAEEARLEDAYRRGGEKASNV